VDKDAIRTRLEAVVKRIDSGSGGGRSSRNIPVLENESGFDSVAALQLILVLEQEFGIVIEDEEIKPENLKNVPALASFIERKLSSLNRNAAR